tara:strand:- start:172 stop:450 length:279 start_codon:yes stop_codon:yes gene_type:complete
LARTFYYDFGWIVQDLPEQTISSEIRLEMICIKTKIPPEICEIDDELKAIYHSKDTVCIWVLKTRDDRNGFMDATIGMSKVEREEHFESFYD